MFRRYFDNKKREGLKAYLEAAKLGRPRALDVGCGRAGYAQGLFSDYIGIDINERDIERARNNNPAGIFHVMDASELDFPDDSFDFSYSLGAFHHMDDETARRAVSEILRVTRPGGHVFIVDAVLLAKGKLIAMPAFWFDRGGRARTYDDLRNLLPPTHKPDYSNHGRFLGIGYATFAWKKRKKK